MIQMPMVSIEEVSLEFVLYSQLPVQVIRFQGECIMERKRKVSLEILIIILL